MLPVIGALLGQGLNLLANAALAKGKDWVEAKTGVKIPDGQIPPEIAAQLKIKEMEHEEELLKIRQEDNRLEKEIAEMYLKDTADARGREKDIATSEKAPMLNKVATPVLPFAIVGLTFILYTILMFTVDGDLKPAQERIIIFVVGALTPICGQVVSYYFGSSRGDAAKDQRMHELMKERNAGS